MHKLCLRPVPHHWYRGCVVEVPQNRSSILKFSSPPVKKLHAVIRSFKSQTTFMVKLSSVRGLRSHELCLLHTAWSCPCLLFPLRLLQLCAQQAFGSQVALFLQRPLEGAIPNSTPLGKVSGHGGEGTGSILILLQLCLQCDNMLTSVNREN